VSRCSCLPALCPLSYLPTLFPMREEGSVLAMPRLALTRATLRYPKTRTLAPRPSFPLLFPKREEEGKGQPPMGGGCGQEALLPHDHFHGLAFGEAAF
jgi:hypothetical protein